MVWLDVVLAQDAGEHVELAGDAGAVVGIPLAGLRADVEALLLVAEQTRE